MTSLSHYVPNWTWRMAAMGCRCEAVKFRWSAASSTADCALAAACCWISTDVHQPPSLLHPPSYECVRCAAADPSLLETRRELMVMSQLPQPRTPSQAHDLLCRTQAPFVRPQVTHDPLTFSSAPLGLNPNSCILMSHGLPCLPSDTLPDKDTCMLQLILSFLRVLCGRQDSCRSLALGMTRLRIIKGETKRIDRMDEMKTVKEPLCCRHTLRTGLREV